MSNKKAEMDFTISPNGDQVEVHVTGIKGKQCLDATELIESKLGTIEERTNTKEMLQQPEKKVVNVSHVRG